MLLDSYTVVFFLDKTEKKEQKGRLKFLFIVFKIYRKNLFTYT